MSSRVLFQRSMGARWEIWSDTFTPKPPAPTDSPFVSCGHEHGPCVQWPPPSGVHFYAIAFDGLIWTADGGWGGPATVPVHGVEEDGDEVFIPIADVRCWSKVTCGGAKLVKMQHDNNSSMHWRCPKCGGYYGEVITKGDKKCLRTCSPCAARRWSVSPAGRASGGTTTE